jgi:hypothetical protein
MAELIVFDIFPDFARFKRPVNGWKSTAWLYSCLAPKLPQNVCLVFIFVDLFAWVFPGE